MRKIRHAVWLIVFVGAAIPNQGHAAASDELATWRNNRQLMRLRDAYIEQEIDFLEAFSDATQSQHLSVPEWRCSVAENTFAAHANAPWLKVHLPEKVRQLMGMRMAWQREVIHFYCLGIEITDEFDPIRHQQNHVQFKVQRYGWRPSEKLAGPMAKCPVPSGITGLTDQWWQHDILQQVRTHGITTMLAENAALARVLEGTGEDVAAAATHLLSAHSRGTGELLRQHWVNNDPMEHRHFLSAMELMRGFHEEARLHLVSGVPIAGRWSPVEFEHVLASKNIRYRSLYRKLSPEMWATRNTRNGEVRIQNYAWVDQ